MKRECITKYENLYKHYSLFFWYQCCSCKKEFRREKGWRGLTGPYYGGSGVWRYLCKTCAPSRIIADDFFIKRKWLPPKPRYRPTGQKKAN